MTPLQAARLIAGLAPRAQGHEPLPPISLAVLLALLPYETLSTGDVLNVLDLPSVGTLSPYLQALTSAGYITRSRDPQNLRRTLCGLTPKGRQLLRSARRPLAADDTHVRDEPRANDD
jgi:DNA-binding MarR family transcriptional regulator